MFRRVLYWKMLNLLLFAPKTSIPRRHVAYALIDVCSIVHTAWHYIVKSGTFKLSSVFTWINSLRNEVRVVVGGWGGNVT